MVIKEYDCIRRNLVSVADICGTTRAHLLQPPWRQFEESYCNGVFVSSFDETALKNAHNCSCRDCMAVAMVPGKQG